MKHNIQIDQRALLKSGLSLNRYVVLDLIVNASGWADELIIDNTVFYWTARQSIVKELPAFSLKPDTVYRIFSDLAKEGWILYEKDGVKDATLALDKAKNLFRTTMSDGHPNNAQSPMSDDDPNTMSDGDPNELGWPSESSSDGHPTYPTTSIYPTTNDPNINTRTLKSPRETMDSNNREFKPPGLQRFKQEVPLHKLGTCGPSKIRKAWDEIDGEQHVDEIITGMNRLIESREIGESHYPHLVLTTFSWKHAPAANPFNTPQETTT